MKRKEFLKTLGAGAAFAITYACLGGCSSENTMLDEEFLSDPETGLLFKINLNDDSSKTLKNNGGYLIKNNVVVAKDLSGNFVAATVVCSHEQKKKVIFRNGEYYCTSHGARFDLEGKGLNSKGGRGIKTYKTSVTDNILSIIA